MGKVRKAYREARRPAIIRRGGRFDIWERRNPTPLRGALQEGFLGK